MKIQDLSFQQELTCEETNIQGGAFAPFSFKPLAQFQATTQTVGASTGGGRGSNTINSPALAVGIQIPSQAVAVANGNNSTAIAQNFSIVNLNAFQS